MSERSMPSIDSGEPIRPDFGAHGHPAPVPIDALLGDDPELWLATADMRAWSEAHPCECEAICECDRAA